jgi:hypothetical protein
METKIVKQTIIDYETHEHKLEVEAQLNALGVGIGIEGHGDCSSEDGYGIPIFLELYDGKVMLRVWTDINNEDPTYVIDMSGALETNRNEQDS